MAETMDYNELAKSIDEMREIIRAAVAALVEDGFTDEQARAMIAGSMSRLGND